MALLFMPLIQQFLHPFKLKPLNGYYKVEKRPDTLNWNVWANETFQKKYNRSVEDSFGLREILIRINNQINYSVFRKTEANNVVIGKNDCLYEKGYILDYTGFNFLGENYLNELLYRFKMVQDTLKKASKTSLILVLEPGKASFYPEYIPDRFLAQSKSMSNMRYIQIHAPKNNINCLDLNAWFCSMKDTISCALYATYGVHWSTYGMYLAADTISRYIEQLRNIDMPELVWQDIKKTDELKDTDFDIEATLNLLFDLPHFEMCYPSIGFKTKPDKIKPKLLTIGDSYYWGFISNQIVDSLYKEHQYWYYFSGIWPDIWTGTNISEKFNLKEEIERQDVVMVGVTELNTFYGFWGFIDELYKIYFPGNDNYAYETIKILASKDRNFERHNQLAVKYYTSVNKILDLEVKNRKKIESWLK